MSTAEAFPADAEPARPGPSSGSSGSSGSPGSSGDPSSEPSAGASVDPATGPGLLDVLGVAAVLLDAEGRIALWSPQAEELFGYTADDALGRYAAELLVDEEHLGVVLSLFEKVMAGGGPWAGAFPVRHKDGSTRPTEFRNMRLEDREGSLYALGIASDQATLRRVERDLALSMRLVAQSPIGLAVLDPELRYVLVNPALERINGLPATRHIGRRVHEALPVWTLRPSKRPCARSWPPAGPSWTGSSPAVRPPIRTGTTPGRSPSTGSTTRPGGRWESPFPSSTSPNSTRPRWPSPWPASGSP